MSYLAVNFSNKPKSLKVCFENGILIVKTACCFDSFISFLHSIKWRLAIITVVAVIFAFFLKKQNVYYLVLVALSATSTGIFRLGLEFYEVKFNYFTKPQGSLEYENGLYWACVFALLFGLALFHATLYQETFRYFQHFVECLYFGSFYTYFCILCYFVYLKLKFQITDDGLDKPLIFLGTVIVPLFFLMVATAPNDLIDVLGVNPQNVYVFSGFVFYESFKEITKHVVKHYKKELTIGSIIATVYHRSIVHPRQSENLGLSAQFLLDPKNTPEQSLVVHEVIHKYGSLYKDGTLGTQSIMHHKLHALKKQAASVGPDELHELANDGMAVALL